MDKVDIKEKLLYLKAYFKHFNNVPENFFEFISIVFKFF